MKKRERTKNKKIRQLRLGAFVIYLLLVSSINTIAIILLLVELFTTPALLGVIKFLLVISITLSLTYLVASFFAAIEIKGKGRNKSKKSVFYENFTCYDSLQSFITCNLIAAILIITAVGTYTSLIL